MIRNQRNVGLQAIQLKWDPSEIHMAVRSSQLTPHSHAVAHMIWNHLSNGASVVFQGRKRVPMMISTPTMPTMPTVSG